MAALIMVLESDEASRKATVRYLEAMGHQILIAENFGAAEQSLRAGQRKPDMIVSGYYFERGKMRIDVLHPVGRCH